VKKLLVGIAATAVGLLVACGGDVVVDGGSSGTGTGATPSTTSGGGVPGAGGTTTQTGNGGTGGLNCSDLPKSLTQCSVSGMTSTGSTPCVITYCEEQGVTWSAKCQETACQCLENGVELCTCALNFAGNICSGMTPDCCYHG
jgi:hypothetical protein